MAYDIIGDIHGRSHTLMSLLERLGYEKISGVARTSIPDDDIESDHLVEYEHDQPPCFLGHYWLEGEPEPLASNIACVDYSVAKQSGKLVAYRWDKEKVLSRDKFAWVDRMEEEARSKTKCNIIGR